MPLCINQSGTYRNVLTLCVNQSGTYRDIKNGCINQSSTYRRFGFTAATITSFTATPSSIATGCGSTLCWTISNATSASISPTVGTISPAVTGSSVVCPSTFGVTTFTLTVSGGGVSGITSTVNVTNTGPALGSAYEGGYLICKQSAASIRWVVSPCSAQVGRSWYDRNDAITVAQQVTGCTGWFVPSIANLFMGLSCRSFWGPAPCLDGNGRYWGSNDHDGQRAPFVAFPHGGCSLSCKQDGKPVRAFRCVSY